MNRKNSFSRPFYSTFGMLFFAIQFFVVIILAFVSFGLAFNQDIKINFFIFISILFLGEIIVFALMHRYFLMVSRQTDLFAELGVEVTKAILMKEDTQSVFLTVLDYVLQIIGNANSGSIHAITEDDTVKIVAARGFDEKYCEEFSIPLEYAFWYRQSEGKTNEPLIISPDIIRKAWHLDNLEHMHIHSVISAPLYIENKLYGFLNIDSHKKNNFKPHDLKVIDKIKSHIEVCLLARMNYERTIAESRADCLTGFHSRTHFFLLASHALTQAKRYGKRLLVAMLDIDDLTAVNDTYGHPTGDLVIISIAKAIRLETRSSDIIGRYGGDEFIALFTETDLESMKGCLNRALERLKKEPLRVDSVDLVVSFSYGFATYPEEGLTLDDLIKTADKNLYSMKTKCTA